MAEPGAYVSYAMRSGDNLYNFAERYFTRIDRYRALQRLNRIVDPYSVPVGRVIRVPRADLRYEPVSARILASRGGVMLGRDGRNSPAAAGAVLREGDRLTTGANAFVSLRLEDHSVITLPSQSRIRVARLRRVLLTQSIERQFALESGQVRAVATPARSREDQFRVSTPVAVSAVRGTEFRVHYDEGAARAATEVLDGRVAMGRDTNETIVQAGFGAFTTTSGVSQAFELLSQPTLLQAGRAQAGEAVTFQIAPLAGATNGYRVEIARDAAFLDVEAETYVREPQATFAGIDDGSYFVRISGLDANGLEGRSNTYSFVRRLNSVSGSMGAGRSGRHREYLFRWLTEGEGPAQLRFQLVRDAPDGPVVVDQVGLTADQLTVVDLPPGSYYWRVATVRFGDGPVNVNWSNFEQFTIAPDE